MAPKLFFFPPNLKMSSSGKMAAFHGSDTEGREYRSVEDSWKVMN
jgi:hypothetical protein